MSMQYFDSTEAGTCTYTADQGISTWHTEETYMRWVPKTGRLHDGKRFY
jgi:hypothetical protein